MRPHRHILRSTLAIAVAMVFLLAVVNIQALAGKKGHGGGGYGGHGHNGHGHKGHGHKGHGHGGHGHGGHGGHHRSGYHSFGVSPYGMSYGYHGHGVRIDVGHAYGFSTPYYGYSRAYYSSPYYYQPRDYYYESYGAVPTYSYDAVPNNYDATTPKVIDSVPSDQPIGAAPQPAGARVIAANEVAAEYQSAAERAFREKRYNDAARSASHAIVEDAGNGKLYLFQSQTLFAIGDYRGAAAAIRRATNLLDASDWGYVVENGAKFYSGRDYVTQMERLVEHAKQNPASPHLHLLRGYHYLYLGYRDAAQKLLARASELDDRDDLTRRLLAMTRDELPPPPAPEELPLSDAGAISLPNPAN